MIRVLLVDDHPLMREAIAMAIEDESDMQVIGEAANGVDAIERVRELKPDVTIMDLALPRKSGLEAIAEIHAHDPHARILALTSSTEDEMVLKAVQAGVMGYLMKDSQHDELLLCIRQIATGNSFFPPHIARKLANSVRGARPIQSATPVEPLTERELDVLRLIGEAASNRQIAQTLSVSEGTVRTHVHNILSKLGLENRNQAILYAIREGISHKTK